LEDGTRFCPHDGTPLTDTSALKTVANGSDFKLSSREIDLPVVVGGRYRLEEVRGGGGMAKVYRGIDLTLEREVAVKLINPDLRIDPEFDVRFQREARIASQLADPHIVVVHDYGLDAAHGPFLVMEYLQGQSLRERLQTAGALPLKAGLQLSAQMMLALMHAHDKNIVHRDIKPDNIFLLNQSGVRLHVRVLDFGIARIYRQEDSTGKSQSITQAGAVLGTPRYMSPEQLAGQPVDSRSDLYSAALVIHEALTTQLPYVAGKKLCELCPEATPALQKLLDQCLSPNPGERPPTSLEVYLQLQELGKASGILLLPPGAMDRLVKARQTSQPTLVGKGIMNGAKSNRRRLALLGAGLLALIALSLLAGLLYWPKNTIPGTETLLGTKIGDDQAAVVERLSLRPIRIGNPWKDARTRKLVGFVLKPENLLNLNETALGDIDFQTTADNKIGVLFFDNKVCAIVVNDRKTARTGRGLRIPGDVNHLYDLYPESAAMEDVQLDEGDHVEIRRYNTQGIGFAIQGKAVVAAALYPADTK
jgi:hypothetical protein